MEGKSIWSWASGLLLDANNQVQWQMVHEITHWGLDSFVLFIFIRPSLDGTYYAMALSVRPSVRPSVRVYESTCIGYYLCTLNTNWIHFVYWIYPTIQCVEHVYIGYLRVITQNTHLVTDAAHVSVKWPSILCPLYWLHTARFFLWWPVGQSEMVAS